MLVEKPASNQLALHLTKLLTDLSSLGSVLTPPLKLVRSVLSMTKIRCRDPRSSVLGPRTCTSSPVESAAPVLLFGRTLARGPPTGLRPTSLAWSIRPKTPFDADSHVIFCKHLNTPIMGYYHTANLLGLRGKAFLKIMWNQIRDQ